MSPGDLCLCFIIISCCLEVYIALVCMCLWRLLQCLTFSLSEFQILANFPKEIQNSLLGSRASCFTFIPQTFRNGPQSMQELGDHSLKTTVKNLIQEHIWHSSPLRWEQAASLLPFHWIQSRLICVSLIFRTLCCFFNHKT